MNHNNHHNFEHEPDFSFNNNRENGFGLPSNYFESLEEKIKFKLELEQELAEFPVLKSISKESVFKIPNNYFNSNNQSLSYRVELAEFTTLNNLKKPIPEVLSAEYTVSLGNTINNKIEILDEITSYPTLFQLNKTNPFFVSENYFDTVAIQVKEKIYTNPNPRLSIIDTILNFIFGNKLALSFGAITLIIFSVFIYQSSKPLSKGNCETLACIEKQDIINNASFLNLDNEQLIELVNVKKLHQQLNKQTLTSDSTQNESYILDNVNTDQLIEEL